jgi:hypothetical protein
MSGNIRAVRLQAADGDAETATGVARAAAKDARWHTVYPKSGVV